MSVPTELSLEAVKKFMLENGGKVTNHDLVKHFKQFLTNPVNRVEAREHFKEIVNVVATIRTEEGEKFLVLKKKYREPENYESSLLPSFPTSPVPSESLSLNPNYESVCSFSPLQYSHLATSNTSLYTSPSQPYSQSPDPMSPSRAPPPYRAPPPPVVSPTRGPPPAPHILMPPPPPPSNKGRPPPITALLSEEAATAELARQSSIDSIDGADDPSTAPPVPPRRKSSVKSLKMDSNKENCSENLSDPKKRPKSDDFDSKRNSLAESEAEHKISVRDAMQKFNRLASENELQRAHPPSRKKPDKQAAGARTVPEDDAVSVTLLDPKSREWLVRASQCDYQSLHKLSAENPRLATFKDPTSGYTALHWAAKHGNEDVIKLIAGTHQADVNVRSNGGYTPLHIAMQFGHEDIHNLLVQVYSADPNVRDWSGRKPRQYQMNQGTSVSADTFRTHPRRHGRGARRGVRARGGGAAGGPAQWGGRGPGGAHPAAEPFAERRLLFHAEALGARHRPPGRRAGDADDALWGGETWPGTGAGRTARAAQDRVLVVGRGPLDTALAGLAGRVSQHAPSRRRLVESA